jgi:membrane associated rhomboid family serine protease
MAGATVSQYQNFTSAYMGTVVVSGAIYGVIVAFAFMFPNAELALMFIPVPIKAKYFAPGLVLVDLYLGVSGQSIFGGGGIAHFAHVEVLYFISNYVVLEEESV